MFSLLIEHFSCSLYKLILCSSSNHLLNFNSPWHILGNVDSAIYGVSSSGLTRRQVQLHTFELIKLHKFPSSLMALLRACWFLFWLLFSSRSLRNIKYMGTQCCNNMDLGQLCETLWRCEHIDLTCYLISKFHDYEIFTSNLKFLYNIVYAKKEENEKTWVNPCAWILHWRILLYNIRRVIHTRIYGYPNYHNRIMIHA